MKTGIAVIEIRGEREKRMLRAEAEAELFFGQTKWRNEKLFAVNNQAFF